MARLKIRMKINMIMSVNVKINFDITLQSFANQIWRWRKFLLLQKSSTNHCICEFLIWSNYLILSLIYKKITFKDVIKFKCFLTLSKCDRSIIDFFCILLKRGFKNFTMHTHRDNYFFSYIFEKWNFLRLMYIIRTVACENLRNARNGDLRNPREKWVKRKKREKRNIERRLIIALGSAGPPPSLNSSRYFIEF